MVQSLASASVASVTQGALAVPEEAQPLTMTSTPEAEGVTPGSDELPAVEEPAVSIPEDQHLSPSAPHEGTTKAQEQVEQVGPPVSVQTASLSHVAPHSPECETHPDSNEVSFLRETNVTTAKPSLLMRATWAFLSVALGLGLAGQIAVHERDQIAVLRPDLKPWLQAICDRLNCRVLPWRKIESIVIDSSAFTRIQDDSYRLNLVLKNMAAVPVAFPALELTLTDTVDQPVIRRVLILSDNESDTIDAGLERSVSLTVAVDLAGGADRIGGYRLLAFYP